MNDYYSLLSRAQGIASNPWQAYPGAPPIAPFAQSQLSAFNTIDQAQGAAQPWINEAGAYATQGASPIQASAIGNYSNPYQQMVTNATMGNINEMDAEQQARLLGSSAGSGGLFNDRTGVAQAELARQQDITNNQTFANLNQQNYNQALGAAQQDKQRQAMAAYTFGNLGAEDLQTILQGAQAQLGSGAIQQQQAERPLQWNYNQWQQQQAFPYQQLGWLSGIETGVGSNMGGTSSTTYNPAAPNPWSMGIGAGLYGLNNAGSIGSGLSSLGSGLGNLGSYASSFLPLMMMKRGGGVKGYDGGGVVSPLPWAGVSGYVPSYPIAHGRGVPPSPYVPGSNIDPLSTLRSLERLGGMGGGKRPTGGGTGTDNPIDLSSFGSAGGFNPSPVGTFADMPTAGPGDFSRIYAAGGRVGYADGGASDLSDLSDEELGQLRPVGRLPWTPLNALAPNLTRYLSTPTPPPQIRANAAGKVPNPDYDPNFVPAMSDVANLGMAAIPFGGAEALGLSAAERGATTLARETPQAMRTLGDVATMGAPSVPWGSHASAEDLRPQPPEDRPRPVMTAEENKQVGDLKRDIDALNAKRAKLTAGIGPKGAAIQAAPFDAQITQKNDQIRGINDIVNKRLSNFDAEESRRQAEYHQQVEEYEKTTAPFALRHPGVSAAGRAMPGLSTLGGYVLGRVGGPAHRIANYAGGAGGGALEGALGAYAPTYMDLAMPEGSAARKEADRANADPRFWAGTVLPEAGFSAALGALGAKYGMLRSQALAAKVAAAAPKAPEPAGAPALPPAVRKTKEWPTDPDAIEAMRGRMKQAANGSWYVPGEGFIPKHLWPEPATPGARSIPPTLHGPEMRRGGSVNGALDIARRAIGRRRGYQGGGDVLMPVPPSSFAARFPDDANLAATPLPSPSGAPWKGDGAGAATVAPRSFGAPTGAERGNFGHPTPMIRAPVDPTAAELAASDPSIFAPGVAEAILSVRPDGTMSKEAWDKYEASSPLGPASRGIAMSGTPVSFNPGRDTMPARAGTFGDVRPMPTGDSGGNLFGLSPRGHDALNTFALSLMASRSPWLGQAVGQAGLAATGEYQEAGRYQEAQEQQREKLKLSQEQVDARVRQLNDAADRAHRQENRDTERQTLERERFEEQKKEREQTFQAQQEARKPENIERTAEAKVTGEAKAKAAQPGTMGEEAYNGAAEQYLQTGTFPPQMSRNPQDRNEIINRAYAKAAERGMDPKDLPKQWQVFRTEQTGINRFNSGPQGNTIRSLDVATDHLQTLRQLGQAMQNGNWPFFNELAAKWAQFSGQPQPTNFDSAKQIVGAEIIKAIGVAGAGTKEEREGLADKFNRASSPAQLEGVIDDSIRPLLLGQVRGLRRQFVTATGLGDDVFDKRLLGTTRDFLKEKETGGQPKAAASPAKASRVYQNGHAYDLQQDGSYKPAVQ